MNKSIAMIVAGFITTLVVVGGTVAAAQSGVLNPATTMIQANGDINVPKAAQQEAPPTIEAFPTMEPAPTDSVEIITRTEIIPPQFITQTVVVTHENPGREAELTARLTEAYQVLKQREALYQAKLKEAYDKLNAQAQTSVDASAGQSGGGQSNSQSSPAPAQPSSSGEHKDDHKDSQQSQQNQGSQHSDDSHDGGDN
ncbi:MAG: hypothetical protein M1434_07100 [Chloroflexi bacterium]|nr:hypothetical protein [Chloroflexota bacterium]MCL5274498.1 hypothetical protein [Chloroflexota bacterium]